MSYFHTTLRGLTWATALRVFIRGLTVLRTAILARLLLPVDFGAFGIASMTLYLMEIFTETGINSFLIQEKDDLDRYVNTAWLVSIIRGTLISLIILTTSSLVSTFFHAPDTLPLLYLTSVIPFIRGFINPASIKFQKQLDFHKEFFYRSAILIPETVATLLFVFNNHSALGLIQGLVVSAVVEVILSFVVISPRPRVHFELAQVRLILGRGKWVTGYGLLDYIYSQGDNIVVGRVLGQTPLGIYQNAYKICALPLTEVVNVFYTVSFPLFTNMREDLTRLRRGVLKTISVMFMVNLAVSVLIFLLANPLVLLLLGPNWLSAVPVIRVLAFLGVVRGTVNSFNPLFMALKKAKYVTIITLFSTLGLLITIYPLVIKYGIVGAGLSAMIGAGVALPIAAFFTIRTFRELKNS